MNLHSKITPNYPISHQKFPKSSIWNIFSLLGQTIFLQCSFSKHRSNSTSEPKYSIPSTRIWMGKLTNKKVELSSNPITQLLIDSKKTTKFTSLVPAGAIFISSSKLQIPQYKPTKCIFSTEGSVSQK